MANTGFIDASNLDFTSYKNTLKEFMKGQDRFKDYNFEGSDMSVLLDVLSFNTYQNAFMLNMVGSEMFQDTAALRESQVSHSKELNYVPRSRNSATSLVNVSIVPNDSPSLIVIPKFYSFVCQSAATNRSYIFSTNEAITVRNNGGNYVAENVQVYEGRVVTEYFVANSSPRFTISSANVDISSLDVNVQASRIDTSNTTYTKADDLHGLNANSNIYFVQGAGADKYEVEFGNGVAGRALTPGNVIKLTYRDCSAEEGNFISRFSPAGTISGYPNITVSLANNSISSGGAERESIESMRFNGPRHYATQGRSITTDDYASMIRQQFPSIESIAVFGGEQLPQKRYGKVAIAAKPYGSDVLTQALKNSIKDYMLTRNSVSIDPIFLDPDFFYVEITTNVYFNPNLTSKTSNDIISTVLAGIMKYSRDNLQDFQRNLHFSRLSYAIDLSDNSIVSNETSTRISKRKAPLLGEAQTIIIDYSVPLSTSTKNVNTVESTYFTYTLADIDYISYIADDGNGTLNIYTQGMANQPYILVPSVGVVNYQTGSLTTNPIIYTGYQGYINFYARTQARDFSISRNQILVVDPLDVSITLTKATR